MAVGILKLKSVPPVQPQPGQIDIEVTLPIKNPLGEVTIQSGLLQGTPNSVVPPPGNPQFCIIIPDPAINSYVVALLFTTDVGLQAAGPPSFPTKALANQAALFSCPAAGFAGYKLLPSGPLASYTFQFIWL